MFTIRTVFVTLILFTQNFSNWKAGSEYVSSILVLPDGKSLLSAARNVSWWNLKDKQLIRTFTGHSSDVTHLLFVPSTNPGGENYFVSAAKGDRYINAWYVFKHLINVMKVYNDFIIIF